MAKKDCGSKTFSLNCESKVFFVQSGPPSAGTLGPNRAQIFAVSIFTSLFHFFFTLFRGGNSRTNFHYDFVQFFVLSRPFDTPEWRPWKGHFDFGHFESRFGSEQTWSMSSTETDRVSTRTISATSSTGGEKRTKSRRSKKSKFDLNNILFR